LKRFRHDVTNLICLQDLWSSPYTWGGYAPPVAGDLVVIKQGQVVVLDTDTPVLKFLLIQGGKLIFAEKNVELQAEYILITDGGLLQVNVTFYAKL